MWRDTGLTPRFFFIDAKSLFPMSCWCFHMTYFTFVIAFIGCAFFIILERLQITPMIAFRMLRCRLIGKYRTIEDSAILRRRIRW